MTTDNNDSSLWLENQICFPLYSASNALLRAYRPILDSLDLTYPQYIVMLVLWREKIANVKSIGQCLYLDSGTLTPLLKRLEGKGLITRSRSEKDERITVIQLTETGKQLEQQAKQVPLALAQLNSDMTEDELIQLKQLSEKFFQQLNKR